MDDGSCQYCDLTISLLTVNQNSSPSLCDGWAFANATSNNTPIMYDWSTGSIANNIVNLCTGIYTLTVTDAVGCTFDTTFVIGSIIGFLGLITCLVLTSSKYQILIREKTKSWIRDYV